MTMFKRSRFLICAFLFSCVYARGEVRLPNIFGDHMILQRETTVKIWGWADPGESVMVSPSWSNKATTVTASGNGDWSLDITTPTAGGPYEINIQGSNKIVLSDVLIGEVWICSGQSNMEWGSAQNLPQMIEELPKSTNSQLRLYHIPKRTADYPQFDLESQWKPCGPESLAGFSAVGYFYAKRLQERLGVPVGIINASWGGTPAETWVPKPIIMENAALKNAATIQKENPWWPVESGKAYNAMIAPLINFKIAGAIWYQGESNTLGYSTYADLFKALITEWRKQWKVDFPFYYVQIAPYAYDNPFVGALLREQQELALDLPKTGRVVITDLVDNIKDIHPKDKRSVGNRLAALALGDYYRKTDEEYQSPTYESMVMDKGKLVLHFKYTEGGLRIEEGRFAKEFYIAGEDRIFKPAEVTLFRDRVILQHKEIKQPVAVRFSFSNEGMSNVFNKAGLPLAPFRTDNWPVVTTK